MKALDKPAAQALLATLPDWQHDVHRDAIRRSLHLAGFAQTFAFMTELALVPAQADHHPEWTHAYNRVDIMLTTHDAGGLTQRDIDFAHCADAAFDRFARVAGCARKSWANCRNWRNWRRAEIEPGESLAADQVLARGTGASHARRRQAPQSPPC